MEKHILDKFPVTWVMQSNVTYDIAYQILLAAKNFGMPDEWCQKVLNYVENYLEENSMEIEGIVEQCGGKTNGERFT